ncbi:sigma-70 family RNA polymerase sigma factor [Marinomonas transparens]|uniref:Sigma-70 family RNA polymerase sigma factor n=1 Tax=Marinomonas transparens TaxID=2795388 RepID=A0A934JJE5_9GAMM|nr:sigma-70 family RNA polymerase sigma factor [Marinomonas transparens]MBJ7536881.1 sigma-70 family RNA polymerase sigma factor [Marinomonas transparens]
MTNDAWKREVEQALAQVKLQHQPSFEKLYELTNAKLYGLVLKIIPDQALATDALQEAYHKIWLNAEQHRADLGSAWSWLCQLTRNQAIDRVRQRQRLQETSDEEVPEAFSESEATLWPEHIDLNRCLQTIRAEQQNVIVHAYVYGSSHSELVKKFDAPLGTLKSWIRRGLKELRECLEA